MRSVKTEEVQRIEVSSRHLGRGREEQVTLFAGTGGFCRQGSLHAEVGYGVVEEFLEQVSQAPIPGSERAGGNWTSNPYLEVRIVLWSGDEVCLKSRSNGNFMLPFFSNGVETYNSQLSRTLAALVPEGFLNRGKLTGKTV